MYVSIPVMHLEKDKIRRVFDYEIFWAVVHIFNKIALLTAPMVISM